MPSVLLRQVRSSLGEDAVPTLLRAAGVPYSAEFLADPANWIWYEEAVAMFEAAAELIGDEHIGRRVGEETVRQHAGTPVATLFRSLGSPQAVFEQLALVVTKFSTVTELEPVEVAPGRAVVRARARDGFRRHRHLCEWTTGLLSQPPALFGLPSAEVRESACEVRGDEHCLYTITWDAEGAERAADPLQLVTALEAQLSAMRERLDNVYATAKDLIALGDLDAALARITDRAATAVRAPKYLLAVRTDDGEPLRVHHRGWSDEDPRAAAEALFASDRHEPSRLVVSVASAKRHYGYLMAASPTGAFFPHERDLLAVYASYAATVLDTATALEDARREGERSRALLELSRTLALAGTREEAAQRLVDALPSVIDCDRVDVRLSADEHGEALDPDPRFEDDGAGARVVAPIALHDRVYGTIELAVGERPERLRRTPDLLDRLAGVVAQAATALDNARLIETMDHLARHDNLTGLLGHRAFHESLAALIAGCGPEGALTLASVDVDDFKAINDRFGHPVGDDALLLVAGALRASIRGGDAVFRVGGEEFAVLLPGMTPLDALPLADRLRRAVSAIEFVTPLRISIGLAAWPGDAADAKGLIERADAALYAAKHAGKDCVVTAPAGRPVPAT